MPSLCDPPVLGAPFARGTPSQPCSFWFTWSWTEPGNTDIKVPAPRVSRLDYYPGSLLPDDGTLALGLLTREGRFLNQTAHLGEEERAEPTDVHPGTNQPVRLKAGRVGQVSGNKHNCYFYHRWEKLRTNLKTDDLAKMLGVINRERTYEL